MLGLFILKRKRFRFQMGSKSIQKFNVHIEQRQRSKKEIRVHVSCTPPPSANKAAHSGFQTQRRCHQKSKTGVSVGRESTYVLQKLKQENRFRVRFSLFLGVDEP